MVRYRDKVLLLFKIKQKLYCNYSEIFFFWKNEYWNDFRVIKYSCYRMIYAKEKKKNANSYCVCELQRTRTTVLFRVPKHNFTFFSRSPVKAGWRRRHGLLALTNEKFSRRPAETRAMKSYEYHFSSVPVQRLLFLYARPKTAVIYLSVIGVTTPRAL